MWNSWVTAQGIDMRHPGVQSRADLLEELQRMSATLTEFEVVRYTHAYTLREELERYQTRVYSDTWKIPEAIFEPSVQELHARLIRDYDSLDKEVEDEVRFAIDMVRFES